MNKVCCTSLNVNLFITIFVLLIDQVLFFTGTWNAFDSML